MAQRLKRLPAMQETRVRSLGLEDSLEKEMATHSSILAWRIPWTEKPGWATVHEIAESDTTEQATKFMYLSSFFVDCQLPEFMGLFRYFFFLTI